MNRLLMLIGASALLVSPLVLAHPGHAVPGTLAHDLQHQLWTFAALIVLSALLLTGDMLLAAVRKMPVRPSRKTSPRRD